MNDTVNRWAIPAITWSIVAGLSLVIGFTYLTMKATDEINAIRAQHKTVWRVAETDSAKLAEMIGIEADQNDDEAYRESDEAYRESAAAWTAYTLTMEATGKEIEERQHSEDDDRDKQDDALARSTLNAKLRRIIFSASSTLTGQSLYHYIDNLNQHVAADSIHPMSDRLSLSEAFTQEWSTCRRRLADYYESGWGQLTVTLELAGVTAPKECPDLVSEVELE